MKKKNNPWPLSAYVDKAIRAAKSLPQWFGTHFVTLLKVNKLSDLSSGPPHLCLLELALIQSQFRFSVGLTSWLCVGHSRTLVLVFFRNCGPISMYALGHCLVGRPSNDLRLDYEQLSCYPSKFEHHFLF